MILIFKLAIVTAFLIPLTLIIFRLIVALRLASTGRKESNPVKTKTGRTTALNALVALILLLTLAYFIFTEFVKFE